jgi:hypothetical protein
MKKIKKKKSDLNAAIADAGILVFKGRVLPIGKLSDTVSAETAESGLLPSKGPC